MKAFALASLGCLLLACGDDATAAPVDAGDTAGSGGPRPGLVPRRNDLPSGEPIAMCDRFNPLACGAGQECRLLIRGVADGSGFEILEGCVEGLEGRALGDPCDPWGGGILPYQVPGLQAEVYVDPCEEGLSCAPDPKVRYSYSCQTACGRDFGVGCASPTQYCLRAGDTNLQDVCRESDACDPHDPSACGPGAGCYVRLNDNADGVLSVCLPVALELAADGEPCERLNSCHPGSSCLPSVRLAVNDWLDPDWVCHRHCLLSADTSSDAGIDEDAGSSTGASDCPGGAECLDLPSAGFDTSAVGFPVGQCQ